MARKKKITTQDSFQNFQANLGLGTDNVNSASTYGFDPISVNRQLLEFMYRGSWIVGNAVDVIADDMVQSGITIQSTLDPEKLEMLHEAMNTLCVWDKLNEVIKWSRLYGGAIAIMLIDGQDLSTEFDPESVGEGQFKGLLVMDRWQLIPSVSDLVGRNDGELGPDMGMPRYYQTIGDAILPDLGNVHYSRVLRFDGYDLPHYQKSTNSFWGTSVIERINDRLIAFDSTSTGVAQLVYRAHLRTWKLKGLRDAIGTNSTAVNAILKNIKMVRQLQANEGITLMDSEDEFATHTYNFAGLDDVLLQFGQQLAGALEIPLVRMFGQSPAGMNSTGESDLRTYYDGIKKKQETKLRTPINKILNVLSRSVLGDALPKGTVFKFNPLWQMNDKEKAEIATQNTSAIIAAYEAGLITADLALKELRQASEVNNIFSNITSEDIDAAKITAPKGEIDEE
jgi:phage-related protein (TIGR01555 family)